MGRGAAAVSEPKPKSMAELDAERFAKLKRLTDLVDDAFSALVIFWVVLLLVAVVVAVTR